MRGKMNLRCLLQRGVSWCFETRILWSWGQRGWLSMASILGNCMFILLVVILLDTLNCTLYTVVLKKRTPQPPQCTYGC